MLLDCPDFSDLKAEFIFPLLRQDSVSLQAKSSWLLRVEDKQVTLLVAKFLVAAVKTNSGSKS